MYNRILKLTVLPLAIFGLIAAFLSFCVAIAQTMEPGKKNTPLQSAPSEPIPDEIIVTAMDIRKITEAIDKLASRVSGQIPRWNRSFCFGIYGVEPEYQKIVTDAIIRAAQNTTTKATSGKCAPEVVIVLTKEANSFARDFMKLQPSLYKDVRLYGLPQRDEKEAWMRTAPVRWLVKSEFESRISSSSRISIPGRESKQEMFVLVDLRQCDGKTWEQLSDYIAMVVLANPRPNEHGPPGSIMALFDHSLLPEGEPPRLTELDRRMLRALYVTDEQVSGKSQLSAIANLVTRAQNRPLAVDHSIEK